jgi:hypothetical protein
MGGKQIICWSYKFSLGSYKGVVSSCRNRILGVMGQN